jgi:hypothetical protein
MILFSKTLFEKVDLRFLTKALFIFSLTVIVLIPCDVLAVTLAPVVNGAQSVPHNFTVPNPFNEIGSDGALAYKQAFKSSKVFGPIDSTDEQNQEAPSIDKIITNYSLKGIVSLGGAEAIIEKKEEKIILKYHGRIIPLTHWNGGEFLFDVADLGPGFSSPISGTLNIGFSNENKKHILIINTLREGGNIFVKK